MRNYAAALMFVTLSVACGPSAELPQSQDDTESTASQTEIRQFLESYYSTFSARDWVRFEELFWPGATMTTVWTPPGETVDRVVTTTIPVFVFQAPQGPDSREIFEERLASTRIRVEGDIAQAWTRYHARFGDPGDIMEWDGVDAFTLLRFQGEWRIAALVYMDDAE